MYETKPLIIIHHNECNKMILKEIMAGLEEEGVPYKQDNFELRNAYDLSKSALKKSTLEVGIGIYRSDVKVIVKGLKENTILFQLASENALLARTIGNNAARYVKGIPFKI